jgi:hypothetical protein
MKTTVIANCRYPQFKSSSKGSAMKTCESSYWTTRVRVQQLVAGLLIGIPLLSSSHAWAVPILEYKFNETGNTAPSTGSDTTSVQFGTNNAGTGYTFPADLHGAAGSGVSEQSGDRAFDNTASTAMGSPSAPGGGGVARHTADDDSVDDLNSFTATGWFKSADTFTTGARLISSLGAGAGFSLFAGSTAGTLTVGVDNLTQTTAASFGETNKWIFFAVTYDGTQASNNVKVYRGYRNSTDAGANPVLDLVSTLTINAGDINSDSALFAIGNSNGTDGSIARRPYDGLLDNIRVFGADTGAAGVSTQAELNTIRYNDAPAIVALSAAVNGTVIQGGDATLGVTVDNNGVGDLTYTVSSSALAGTSYSAVSPSPAVLTQGGTPVAHTVTADTTAGVTPFGANALTFTITDTNASSNPTTTQNSTLTVLDHANASFTNASGPGTETIGGGGNTLLIDFGTVLQGAGGGQLNSFFDVFAEISIDAGASFTADLDLISITDNGGDTAQLFRQLGNTSFSSAAGASESYTYSLDTTAIGSYSVVYTFNLSDDLSLTEAQGRLGQTITLTLQGQVVTIPEPSTIALFSIGIGAILRRGRKSSRRHYCGH